MKELLIAIWIVIAVPIFADARPLNIGQKVTLCRNNIEHNSYMMYTGGNNFTYIFAPTEYSSKAMTVSFQDMQERTVYYINNRVEFSFRHISKDLVEAEGRCQ